MWKIQTGYPNRGGIALSIIPTLTLEGTVFGFNKYVTMPFKFLTYAPLWFLYVYVLIGYIKSHKDMTIKPKTSLVIAGALYLGMFIVTMILFHGVGSGKLPNTWQFATWRQLNSPICLLSAYFLFAAARDAKQKSINLVNHIAGYTYGIYLFQCHKTFQGFLWTKILCFEKYFHMTVFAYVLYSILGVCAIVSMGFLLDCIYKKVFVFLQETIPILR